MKWTKRHTVISLITVLVVIIITVVVINRKRLKKTVKKTADFIADKTWDIYTDRRIATLHPLIREKASEFINKAEKAGYLLRVVSALRTWEQQTAIYNQPHDGKDNDGDGIIDEADEKATNAKAGQSYHNYGLAIDVVQIKNGKTIWNNPNWSKIAAIGKSLGFEWGGDWKSFKDLPHFQITFGKSYAVLRKLYLDGNRQGNYVNIA